MKLRPIFNILAWCLLLVAIGCRHESEQAATAPAAHQASAVPVQPTAVTEPLDPCRVVLVPHEGAGQLDREIVRWQEQVRTGRDSHAALERLGWLFVAKARRTLDHGYYKLAEQCALCLESRRTDSPEAKLLRGHVLHNLHRFKEAEQLARELVNQRGLAFDYGLWGDALMEQGRLTEAIEAYQKMMDLRPDLQAYSRAAHVRWLKGDLDGAVEVAELAAKASSPVDPESAAWAYTRLGFYQLQTGATEAASASLDAALTLQEDYAPALLWRGRALLSANEADQAVPHLEKACQKLASPESLWALAEALRESGREEEALSIESQLCRKGAATDARTLSLYLATRKENVATAVALAEEELKTRADVFTHDALAWALAAAGRLDEAQQQMNKALAEGTSDARLFFHATAIAAQAGRKEEAEAWFEKAADQMHLLLPSELEQLLEIEFGEPDPARPTQTQSSAEAIALSAPDP